jgi:hypothetical protein
MVAFSFSLVSTHDTLPNPTPCGFILWFFLTLLVICLAW